MATLVMERPKTGQAEAQADPSGKPGEHTATRQRIIDCDVHHRAPGVEALFPICRASMSSRSRTLAR